MAGVMFKILLNDIHKNIQSNGSVVNVPTYTRQGMSLHLRSLRIFHCQGVVTVPLEQGNGAV